MAVSVNSISTEKLTPHILVVDDDASIRLLLSTFFEKVGYLVSVASSGTEALRSFKHALHKQPVDVILLDMKMPGMNGLQVCEELRQSSDVPVIVLSGTEEDQGVLAKVGLGIEDFIQKPFRVREVEGKVKEILESISTLTPSTMSEQQG